jgi:hypothetical protein
MTGKDDTVVEMGGRRDGSMGMGIGGWVGLGKRKGE